MEVKTYESVEEHHREGSNIRPPSEQRHRDERILSHPGLAIDEGENHAPAHHKQRNDLCRVPRKQHSTKVQSEQNHKCTAKEGKDADPIYSFDTVDERCMLMLDIQEDQDKERSYTRNGEVDPNYSSTISQSFNRPRMNSQHQRH
jgi:hypothetical protein